MRSTKWRYFLWPWMTLNYPKPPHFPHFVPHFMFLVARPHQHSIGYYTQNRTLSKIWVGTFLVRNVYTIHVKTDIYCVVMTAWSILWANSNCCVFWNDPLRPNFQNSVPKVYMAIPIDVVVFNCRKILNLSDGKSVKSCGIYLTKNKISAVSQTVATAWIAPKIYQDQPPTMRLQCSRFYLPGKSVHFRRSYGRTREHRFFAP